MTRRLSRLRPIAIAALCGAALGGCGGGGTQSSVVPATAVAKIPPGRHSASITLVINVPKRVAGTAKTRSAQFVSPAVRSISVSVAAPGQPAGPPMPANVSCTNGTCAATVIVPAPVGTQDTFNVIAYDALNATGNVLSSASVTYNVAAGGTTTIPVVLAGVVATIRGVSVTNAHPLTGSSATATVAVTALDASGAVIAGSYASPLNVQLFENDPDVVFSLANATLVNGIPLSLLHSSSETATIALAPKAGGDVTTPDDATVVATAGSGSFVPSSPAIPAPGSYAEMTTACPATSPSCVYYPTGDEIIAAAPNDITQWTYLPSGTAQWASPGSPGDPDGGKSIWNLASGYLPASGTQPLGLVLRFNTQTGTFAVEPGSMLGAGSLLTDIGGTLWAASAGLPNPADSPANPVPPSYGVFAFTPTGNPVGAFITDPAATAQQTGLATAFDSAGRLWANEAAGLFTLPTLTAFSPATNAAVACTFSASDGTFIQGSAGGPISVAGSTVWAAFSAGPNGNAGYVLKLPAALGSGCAPGVLSTLPFTLPASANAAVAPDIIEQTLVDAAGNLYTLEPTLVTRITNAAGTATNIVDLGATVSSSSIGQMYVAFALDPLNPALYLLDALNGTLDRASSVTPAAGVLPSTPLPAVLGAAAAVSSTSNGISAQLFFQPDGSLWIANASFDSATALYSILGSVGTVTDTTTGIQLSAARGGMVRMNVASAVFAQSAKRATRSIGQIRAMARSRYLRSRTAGLQRRRAAAPAPKRRP